MKFYEQNFGEQGRVRDYNRGESRGAMTTFEQILLREVAELPEQRRADVLAFVRFLKISLLDESEMERLYDEAIADARATAEKYKITEADIEAEIRAVRDGK